MKNKIILLLATMAGLALGAELEGFFTWDNVIRLLEAGDNFEYGK